jgi:hypothetical protein
MACKLAPKEQDVHRSSHASSSATWEVLGRRKEVARGLASLWGLRGLGQARRRPRKTRGSTHDSEASSRGPRSPFSSTSLLRYIACPHLAEWTNQGTRPK